MCYMVNTDAVTGGTKVTVTQSLSPTWNPPRLVSNPTVPQLPTAVIYLLVEFIVLVFVDYYGFPLRY